MSEELKPTGSIGDYAKFHELLNAAYESCGALDQASGKDVFPASDKLTEVQNRLIGYIDDWATRRASYPAISPQSPDVDDARDAARWREAMKHIGGAQYRDAAIFSFNYLKPASGANLMRGSVSEHFTKAIDAAIAMSRTAKEP